MILAHRTGSAMNFRKDTDLLSADGLTWDKLADTSYFYESSDAFRELVMKELQDAESPSLGYGLDDLSPEVRDLILRIEDRYEWDGFIPVRPVEPKPPKSQMIEDVVSVLFCVSKNNEKVLDVFAITMGTLFSIRQNATWVPVQRNETQLNSHLLHADFFQLDWSTDEAVIDESFLEPDFDGDHIAVKLFDRGELRLGVLHQHAWEILEPGNSLAKIPPSNSRFI